MRRFTPRLGRLLLFAVLAIALFVNASTPGSATTTCPLPTTQAPLLGSTFEGADGNLVADCGTDWATPAPNLQIGVDQPSGPTDDSFGQGTKEDTPNPTIVSGSIPPNKNDLTRYYVGSEYTGGQNYLYLAWERIANIGSVDVDFELNQSGTKAGNGVTPVRTAGDALVTYDFSGSATPTIGVARWVTSGTCTSGGSAPCWGPITALTSTAEAAVNAGTITDPISTTPTALTAGLFGEAAINLTAVGLFHAGTCTAFGSAYLKSRSSGSFTSEIKDFIAPKSVTISNCGEVKIIKHTDTRGIPQDFGFTSTITGTASFTLNDKGNSTADSVGNTRDITNVVPGTYSVTEGAEPMGFTLESLTCTSGSQDSTNPAQAKITVLADSVVTCTYTNQATGAIKITKKSSTTGAALPGTTFTITDPSGNVVPNTPQTGLDGTACVGGLAFGKYTVQETGAPSGYGIDNKKPQTVTVGANSTCGGGNVATIPLTQTIPFTDTLQPSAITISKSSTTIAVTAAGQVVPYSYLVTNTGATTVTSIAVMDNNVNAAGVSCPATWLSVGSSMTCTALRTVTQQVMDTGGKLTNLVTVTSSAPTVTDTLSIPITQSPKLALDKSAQEATYSKVGDIIHYSYSVLNSGNITLNGPFTVSDDKTTVSCPSTPASLAPSATLTCTATYTIQQADLDNGSVTNHATATNGIVTSNPDEVTVTAVRSPALSLTKTPSPLTYSAVGQTITYSYTVTNSGNVTLAGPFTISDDKLGTISCPTGSLNVGTSVVCTASHTINQTDLNTGSITNTATASTTYSSSTITSNQAQATVTAYTNPTISTTQVITPNDTATISGATGNVGGTITFKLFAPNAANDCSGTPALTQTVNVSGNGTYSTTNTTFGARAEGTWRWQVVFSGDTNNAPATSACGVEQFTISNHSNQAP